MRMRPIPASQLMSGRRSLGEALALIAIGLLVLMSGLAITGIRRFARR